MSARSSRSRGHGLGLLLAPVLPSESWTVAPPRNWEAQSRHQNCCEQGSGPCVTCQAPPRHPLRSSLTDHTWDLTCSWRPISVSQWIYKNCGPERLAPGPLCHQDTESITLTLEIRDAGLLGPLRRSIFGGLRMAEAPPSMAEQVHALTPHLVCILVSPPLRLWSPFCTMCLTCPLSLFPSCPDPAHGCAR